MKTKILTLLCILFFRGIVTTNAQTPVTDVGAGIQREALWTQEQGILSKINKKSGSGNRVYRDRIDILFL